MLVLDTCALLWHCLDPDSLSPAARGAIERTDTLLVSSISFWEIAMKEKKGELELPMPPASFAHLVEQVAKIRVMPVDTAQWLASVGLAWEHRDPADRLIVALATLFRAGLVSADQRIRDWYAAPVW
jgi:PIN domain nuclease of toxin-antitoxin system